MLGAAAAMLATVAFGPAVPVARGYEDAPGGGAVTIFADPRSGGWILHPGASGERLARVREDGGVSDEALPSELGEENEPSFTPLANGWGVAMNHFYPGGTREAVACSNEPQTENPHVGCGEEVIAQRSPAGHWTQAQRLTRLDSSADPGIPAPVLAGDRIEAAWVGRDIDVISAVPGRRFGRLRSTRKPLLAGVRGEGLAEYRGRIYVEGQYGPRGGDLEGRHHVRRVLRPDGSLGKPVFFVRGEYWGGGVATLPAGGGAELFVYDEAGSLGVLRRAPGATHFTRSVLLDGGGTLPQLTQNTRYATLVTVMGHEHGRFGLYAGHLGPAGRPAGRMTLVQTDPAGEGEEDLRWSSAVNAAGDALIGVIDEDAPAATALHASAPGCRGWSSFSGGGPEAALDTFAGARGTFHFVWTTLGRPGEIETATARVSCGS